MATGPEHYREAEKHLDYAKAADLGDDSERFNLGAAQVHATLALAAAVGTYGESDATRTINDVRAWERVAGEYTAQQRRDAAERTATAAEAAQEAWADQREAAVDEALDARNAESEA